MDLCRVGQRVLFRSKRIVLLHSFKEHNILLRSFLEFLATYKTQKNNAFFSVLFIRTLKNARMFLSFAKEHKRKQKVAFFFSIYIYIDI